MNIVHIPEIGELLCYTFVKMKLNLFLSGISDRISYDLQATFGFQEKHRQG